MYDINDTIQYIIQKRTRTIVAAPDDGSEAPYTHASLWLPTF